MGSNERLLLTRLQQPNPYVSAVLIEQEEDVSMGSLPPYCQLMMNVVSTNCILIDLIQRHLNPSSKSRQVGQPSNICQPNHGARGRGKRDGGRESAFARRRFLS